jgi:hypothetical protein
MIYTRTSRYNIAIRPSQAPPGKRTDLENLDASLNLLFRIGITADRMGRCRRNPNDASRAIGNFGDPIHLLGPDLAGWVWVPRSGASPTTTPVTTINDVWSTIDGLLVFTPMSKI